APGDTVGYYRLTPSTVTYLGEATLQVADEPTEMTVVGNNLLVAGGTGGDVENCTLAPTGVSGCHTIATLPGGGGSTSGSVAVVVGTP
ncbi:MAG TPA: hypothetical protein VKV25_10325, partial [Acidimicrobiales bacterium]|nr:hypothetical protein [Acidimicrobiales bacterium]